MNDKQTNTIHKAAIFDPPFYPNNFSALFRLNCKMVLSRAVLNSVRRFTTSAVKRSADEGIQPPGNVSLEIYYDHKNFFSSVDIYFVEPSFPNWKPLPTWSSHHNFLRKRHLSSLHRCEAPAPQEVNLTLLRVVRAQVNKYPLYGYLFNRKTNYFFPLQKPQATRD